MKTKKRFLCTIDEEDGEFVTLKMVPVDLCALLALADEMDHADSEVGWTDDAMPHFARRIREALGVHDA